MQVRKLHQLISVCLFGGKVKACLELKSKTTPFHTELNVSSHMQLGLIHFPFALSCSLWFSFHFVQESFFSITFHTWLAFIGKLLFPFVKVNPHALIVWALREVCFLWNWNVSRLSLLLWLKKKKKNCYFQNVFWSFLCSGVLRFFHCIYHLVQLLKSKVLMRAFVGCRAHSMNLGMAPSLAPLGQGQRVRQEGTEGDLKLLKTQKNCVGTWKAWACSRPFQQRLGRFSSLQPFVFWFHTSVLQSHLFILKLLWGRRYFLSCVLHNAQNISFPTAIQIIRKPSAVSM